MSYVPPPPSSGPTGHTPDPSQQGNLVNNGRRGGIKRFFTKPAALVTAAATAVVGLAAAAIVVLNRSQADDSSSLARPASTGPETPGTRSSSAESSRGNSNLGPLPTGRGDNITPTTPTTTATPTPSPSVPPTLVPTGTTSPSISAPSQSTQLGQTLSPGLPQAPIAEGSQNVMVGGKSYPVEVTVLANSDHKTVKINARLANPNTPVPTDAALYFQDIKLVDQHNNVISLQPCDPAQTTRVQQLVECVMTTSAPLEAGSTYKGQADVYSEGRSGALNRRTTSTFTIEGLG